MSSPASTATAREWTFVLHPVQRPTEEVSDRFDHAPALAGGEIGWEEDADGVRFPCAVRAEHLEEAVTWAARQLDDLGVPIASMEMSSPFVG
ncbi:hypothetical protein ACFU7T_32690 [Streptomyces sp. NPDC057555]|uniref:hypothetical protein n=1 Tax=Streptomyces sp. NPDC057555 TaxID=3346166 RepID=UPI0036AFFE1E